MRYRNKLALLTIIGALLILTIPIPFGIFPQFTIPVQLLILKLASLLLHLAGVPSLRTGHMILFSSVMIDFSETFRIRPLIALVALAILYGYLRDDRRWVRVVLAISAFPIAVVASSFPIVVTGMLLLYVDPPEKAARFYFSFGGLLSFVVSLIMLFILHCVILIIWKSNPRQKSA
ncbi:MAG TPA: archaeosortase/exosortase family protein [Candidatus Eremiobacteraceae bacterium]|nr:archaeosortase/exosortase family protein [Candidatus Eremiobacteraceae bacterium]